MGGCQNYGPLLGTLNIRGRIIIGIQKGTIILTTTRVRVVERQLRLNGVAAVSECPSALQLQQCTGKIPGGFAQAERPEERPPERAT